MQVFAFFLQKEIATLNPENYFVQTANIHSAVAWIRGNYRTVMLADCPASGNNSASV